MGVSEIARIAGLNPSSITRALATLTSRNVAGAVATTFVDDHTTLGLAHDCAAVKPASSDGLVSWLTTHLIVALGRPAVMRTRTRIDRVDDVENCRIDVARSSVPVRAKMSDKTDVFWVRMNNSSRLWPDDDDAEYVRDHWGSRR